MNAPSRHKSEDDSDGAADEESDADEENDAALRIAVQSSNILFFPATVLLESPILEILLATILEEVTAAAFIIVFNRQTVL